MTDANQVTTPNAEDTTPKAQPDPNTLLAELKSSLQEADAKAKALQADIAVLQQAQDKATKAGDAYKQTWRALADQLIALTTAREALAKAVECEIGDQGQAVTDAWRDADTERSALETTRKDHADVLATATTELCQKGPERVTAQQAFDAIEAYQTAVTDRFKRLDQLRKDIEAARSAQDHDRASMLLAEFDAQLKDAQAQLLTADKYRAALKSAWRELNLRKKAVRDAKVKQAKTQQDLQAAEASLQAFDRVERGLALLATARAQADAAIKKSGV